MTISIYIPADENMVPLFPNFLNVYFLRLLPYIALYKDRGQEI
jgi:hypothetical protein